MPGEEYTISLIISTEDVGLIITLNLVFYRGLCISN